MPGKSVFLDTNTYLSLYRLSNNDIRELEKLQHAITVGDLNLITTEQVLDEFRRNRQDVIHDALKGFRQRSTLNPPRLISGYEERDELLALHRQLEAKRASLANQVEEDSKKNALKADELISALFENSAHLPVDSGLLGRARDRYDRGNPPGKKGSYGDAINWEALLGGVGSAVDPAAELFIVSNDGDFATRLAPDSLADFLLEDLEKAGHFGTVYLYKTLGEFFKKHYPDIELEIEFEQQAQVERLKASPNFRTTHEVISEMDPKARFTAPQQASLLRSALENSQIYAIGRDEDVQRFYCEILNKYAGQISADDLPHLKEYFGWAPAR